METTAVLIPMLLLIPLLGGLGLTILPDGDGKNVRAAALLNSLVTLGFSWWIASLFDWAAPEQLQLARAIPWVKEFGLSFSYGVDSISLWLVLLTTFLMPLVVLGSFNAVKERSREFYFWLLLLEAAMLGVFVARDLIFFYICFEFTLVPMFFLIGIFGSTQRLKAAKVFFLYTFTGSMLTFAGVLYVAWVYYSYTGRWTFDITSLIKIAMDPSIGLSATQQAWVLAAMLAGFAVKVPLFPFHTWLPLAHTEAPTAGSVVLAGVLLKLGTYALLRLAIPLAPIAAVQFAPVIGVLAVIGILYTALICWVQKDIKKLIAYSSVSHLGFCVLGMFALNVAGAGGSVVYMINHGLSTGALFLCVGMIYERFHTREMARLGGLAKVMPVWSFFMVYFCLASVGLPGLNGFVGEFLTLLGAFTSVEVLGPAYAATAGVGMILGAIYILYMVGKVVFGPVRLITDDDPLVGGGHGDGAGHHRRSHAVTDLNAREVATLIPLAVACLVLGVYPAPMLESLEVPIAYIVEPAEAVIIDSSWPVVEGASGVESESWTTGSASIDYLLSSAGARDGLITGAKPAGGRNPIDWGIARAGKPPVAPVMIRSALLPHPEPAR